MISSFKKKLPISTSGTGLKIATMEEPGSPVVDLQRNHMDAENCMQCSPKSMSVDHNEPSVGIKCQQDVLLCGAQTKKSNVTCFDGQTDGRVNVIDLVNSLPAQDYQPFEQIHPDKKLEKGGAKVSNVVCIDDPENTEYQPACLKEWKVGPKGCVKAGSIGDVKEFTEILPPYCSAVKTAESLGIPPEASLQVEGLGETVKDVTLGTDCVRGVSLFQTGFDPNCLVDKYDLGSGQYGSVTCCTNKINGAKYAVKKVALDKLNCHEMLVQALAATTQQHRGSKYLAGGYAFFLENTAVKMVMEMAAKTLEQLTNNMKERKTSDKVELAKTIAQQGLEGLKFLSDNNYVHLDIKPQNIGLTRDNQVKLLDFGSCFPVGVEVDRGMTPKYAAKEVLLPYALPGSGRPHYTPKADVYSFGACLISFLQGYHVWDHLLFTTQQYRAAIQYIFSHEEELYGKVLGQIDKSLGQLIWRMTRYNHQDRYTAEQALKDAFFKAPRKVPVQENPGITAFEMLSLGNIRIVDPEALKPFGFGKPYKLNIIKNPASAEPLKPPAMEFEQHEDFESKGTKDPLPVSVAQTVAVSKKRKVRKQETVMPPPAPQDCVLPDLEQIMTNKQRRGMQQDQEETVSVNHMVVEAPIVPQFDDLLAEGSDYTKHSKKRNRTAADQPVMQACDNQFEFGAHSPMAFDLMNPEGFVDLSQRSAGGGKQMPRHARVMPYHATHRKGHF